MGKVEVVNGVMSSATEHKVQQITTRTDSREILANAHRDIARLHLDDYFIVDVDAHHVEFDSWSEILQHLENPVLRHNAISMTQNWPNAKQLAFSNHPVGLTFQDVFGRIPHQSRTRRARGEDGRASRPDARAPRDGFDGNQNAGGVPAADAGDGTASGAGHRYGDDVCLQPLVHKHDSAARETREDAALPPVSRSRRVPEDDQGIRRNSGRGRIHDHQPATRGRSQEHVHARSTASSKSAACRWRFMPGRPGATR